MFRLLSEPYPCVESSRVQWIRAIWIGLFIAFFLLTFQPFGIDSWDTPNKFLKISGFGVISFLLTGLSFTAWAWFFPNLFSEKNWTVGRQITLILLNILLIAIANRLYLAWLIYEKVSLHSWFYMISVTFLVGIFPTAGSVIASYIVRLRQYTRLAAELPPHQTTLASNVTSPPLSLTADNEKESITLPPTDLFFIESSDNYCTVVYRHKGQTDKVLLRSSLSRLEKQIQRPAIVRCHRSYVVNLDQVERVTGNAQGYKLHLAGGLFTVPVARQYNDSLVAQLKN